MYQDNFAEAVPLLKQALERSEERLGEEDDFTIRSMINLGSAYGRLRRYDEEAPLLKRAIDVSSRVFGKGHELTLGGHPKFGGILLNAGAFL